MGADALWQSVQGQLAFLLVALGGAALLPGATWSERLSLGPGRLGGGRVLALVVGFLALSNALHAAVAQLGLLEGTTLAEIDRITRAEAPARPALVWLAFALAPALGEELLFRGFVQRLLGLRWPGARAVLGAAVLFGAAHLDLVHGPAAAILGVYLGAVTHRAGSLRPALLCHVTNNSLALAGTAGLTGSVGGGAPEIALGLGLVGACLALGLVGGRRLQPTPLPADGVATPQGEHEDDSSGPDRR